MARQKTKVFRSWAYRPPRGRYRPCAVCGKHRAITELAHLVSLEEVAARCERAGVYPIEVLLAGYPMTAVFLCPNHHAIYDGLQKGRQTVLEDCQDDEKFRLHQLREREIEEGNKLREAICKVLEEKESPERE